MGGSCSSPPKFEERGGSSLFEAEDGVVKDEPRGHHVRVVVGLVDAAEECESNLFAEEELEEV